MNLWGAFLMCISTKIQQITFFLSGWLPVKSSIFCFFIHLQQFTSLMRFFPALMKAFFSHPISLFICFYNSKLMSFLPLQPSPPRVVILLVIEFRSASELWSLMNSSYIFQIFSEQDLSKHILTPPVYAHACTLLSQGRELVLPVLDTCPGLVNWEQEPGAHLGLYLPSDML